jgi:DNA-binding MarR family transcriptional regulator
MSDYDNLKLENQLCFPVYAVSRLLTREYQPMLDALGITYPQYLVLMVLWEHKQITVNEIAKTLILNTNTITPLLKRMEKDGLLKRTRSKEDERKVMVELTKKGMALKEEAVKIPEALAQKLLTGNLQLTDIVDLKTKLEELIGFLSDERK